MIVERRKRHENELHEKYLQLYHNEQCYEELIKILEEAYQNRPVELRRLDGKREIEPNWYRNRNMLGMTMYPKLFAGGLKGVIEHLDYLSEQKITYLHLMPLLKMPHPYNDGGYAVEDFKEVDPGNGLPGSDPERGGCYGTKRTSGLLWNREGTGVSYVVWSFQHGKSVGSTGYA